MLVAKRLLGLQRIGGDAEHGGAGFRQRRADSRVKSMASLVQPGVSARG